MEKKTLTIRETNIPNNFKMAVESEITTTENGVTSPITLDCTTDPKDQSNDCTDMYSAMFTAIASIMSNDIMKPKASGKAALVFTNPRSVGEVVMACISEYSEEDGSGNWYFRLSFDPEDIKGIEPKNIFNANKLEKIEPFAHHFNAALCQLHSKMLGSIDIINSLAVVAIETLKNWLDSNAEEGTIVELVINDRKSYKKDMTESEWNDNLITYAIASVEIVKGIKKMSCVFGEELKAIAKGNIDRID